jgi:hypothetical protein
LLRAMPDLSRRRYPERPDCWHVYYGDVHVGTIARRVGNPHDTDPKGVDQHIRKAHMTDLQPA